MWKEIEAEYGVLITLDGGFCRPGKAFHTFVQNIYYKRISGAEASKRKHYRSMEYPSRNYRTFPAGLVYHLSNLVACLEDEQRREKEALEQTDMFPSA